MTRGLFWRRTLIVLCGLLVVVTLAWALATALVWEIWQREPENDTYEGALPAVTDVTGVSRTDKRVTAAQKRINVPRLCQYPDLPTGCEATAAVMVLRYYGAAVTPEVFAREWLECSTDFTIYDGLLYGPDPDEQYAGDPFTTASYGCFAGPIVAAVRAHCDTCTAREVRGEPLAALCETYIDDGKPLLIWATMNMRPSCDGKTWLTPARESFTWPAGEHCLVLVGYDEEAYIFNDPMTGTAVSYPRETVERRYEELGRRAVVIAPR